MRIPQASILGAVLLASCGGRSAPPAGGATDDAGDAGADYDMQGVYRCCAKGTGRACCEGVPLSPTGDNMCFEYGGYYQDCRREGEVYEGKIICARCCDGLERSSVIVPGDEVPPELDELPEGCDFGAPDSILVCIRCGDGVCGPGESFCNCPEDCPRP
jgi:hypothetical protein